MKKILKYVGMWTWEILQSIVGGILVLLYGGKLIEVIDERRIYVSKKMSGGISLGMFILLDDRYERDVRVKKHEYGHTKQSQIWGPLYLPVPGLCSLVHAAFFIPKYKNGRMTTYYDYWTERDADMRGGVIR